MGTLHQLRVADNTVEPNRDLLAKASAAIRELVDAELGADADFRTREEAVLRLSNEAARLCVKNDLDDIAALYDGSNGVELEVDGCIYRPHEAATGVYHSLCGRLEVPRWTYREVGVRNGPCIVPLELAAGLVENATPSLGYRVALGYAKGNMRSCEEDMRADHRCPPSRSTLERMGVSLGTGMRAQARSIEPHLRRAESLPEGAVSVSIGVDRTSTPMEEDVPDGDKPTGRRKPRDTPYVRAIPKRVNVNYRMAYVGTLTVHDEHGEPLVSRRYAIGAHESADNMVRRLGADLHTLLAKNQALHVGVVQDGAPEMWNLIRECLNAEPLLTSWYEVIDRYHLNERFGSILRLVEEDPATRQRKISRWNDSLDKNDNAIYHIRQWTRDQYEAAETANDDALCEHLSPHLTYLENNAALMRYARVLESGLPIGSGATEGACKSVIEKRTNGSGQRWRTKGLSAVLALRSIYMSDRLPRFWTHFLARTTKEVRCAA